MEKNICVTPTTDLRHRKQYADAGSIAAQMAISEIAGLNLQETIHLWSCLAMIIKDCDDYLDKLTDEDKRNEYAKKILDILFSEEQQLFENSEFYVVKKHIEKLDEKRKRRIKRYGKLLFLATEKVKKSNNYKEYSKFVAVEGALTMEFLISLLFINDSQLNDEKKFKKWSKEGVAMGNLFDSLIDLKADKRNGLFKELPVLKTSLKLINDIVIYLVRVFPHMPKKYILKVVQGNLKAIFINK